VADKHPPAGKDGNYGDQGRGTGTQPSNAIGGAFRYDTEKERSNCGSGCRTRLRNPCRRSRGVWIVLYDRKVKEPVPSPSGPKGQQRTNYEEPAHSGGKENETGCPGDEHGRDDPQVSCRPAIRKPAQCQASDYTDDPTRCQQETRKPYLKTGGHP
jgi:hypothetical protein